MPVCRLSTTAPTPVPLSSPEPAGPKKIRYAVIGVGGIGQLHMRFARQHPQVELVAVADNQDQYLNQAQLDHQVAGYSDYREMLQREQIDALSICTPHYLLADIGLDCLQAGAHLFIEKPLALRLSDADKLIQLAEAENLKICVGYQYRTYRTPQRIKQVVDSGQLGKIRRILWTWLEFRPESYYSRAPWRTSWQGAGGGLLMNQISHEIDLICWLFGPPVEVSAVLSNQLHDTELDDAISANLRFACGATAVLQANINEPRTNVVKQISGDLGSLFIADAKPPAQDPIDEIQIAVHEPLSEAVHALPGDHDQPGVHRQRFGPAQNIVDQIKPPLRKILKSIPGLSKILTGIRPSPRPVGHQALLNSFIEAITEDTEPLVTAQSARQTLEVINALILSGIKHKTLSLPVKPEEYDQLLDELVRGSATVDRTR